MPFLKNDKGIIALTFIVLSSAAIALLLIGTSLRHLIDQGFASSNSTLFTQSFLPLSVLIIVIAVASFTRSFCVNWLGEKVANDIRQSVLNHLLKLSPRFFETHPTGELMSRLNNDTILIQTVLSGSASVGLRSLIQLFGGIAMLSFTSARLLLIVLLIVPVVLLPLYFLARKLKILSKKYQATLGLVSQHIQESLEAIQTVQAYGREAYHHSLLVTQQKKGMAVAKQRILYRSALVSLVIFLVFSGVAFTFWLGGQKVLSHELSRGELMAFVFYAVLVAGSINSLSEVVGDLSQVRAAMERITDLLSKRPLVISPPPSSSLRRIEEGHITFEKVSFAYPANPHQKVLEDFDLTLKKGKTLAIVGPSGAGKSTLFNLLLRFYDPEHGRLLIDGLDLREMDLTRLRSSIGYVPQAPYIFNANILMNVAYGRLEATPADLTTALKAAEASDFVRKLPHQSQTIVGGNRLSGGQKQRLSLARAILRDAPILLLDEATNALDAESDFHIVQALEHLKEKKTILIIAHRLSTVMKADKIIVLDQGKIVGEGRHKDLLKKCSLYKRLADLQFLKEDAEKVA